MANAGSERATAPSPLLTPSLLTPSHMSAPDDGMHQYLAQESDADSVVVPGKSCV